MFPELRPVAPVSPLICIVGVIASGAGLGAAGSTASLGAWACCWDAVSPSPSVRAWIVSCAYEIILRVSVPFRMTDRNHSNVIPTSVPVLTQP